MEHRKGNHRLDKETILADVLKILEEMTAEWEARRLALSVVCDP